MKIIALAAASLLFVHSASAAKVAGLADFAGTFRGSNLLNAGGVSYSGTSKMVFKAAKNGRSGSLVTTASIAPSGTPLDVGNTFTFRANKNLGIAKLAPAVADIPLTGRYSLNGRTKTITGKVTYVDGGTAIPITVKVTLRKSRTKATLKVVYTITQGATVLYTYTYTGTRPLKRSER